MQDVAAGATRSDKKNQKYKTFGNRYKYFGVFLFQARKTAVRFLEPFVRRVSLGFERVISFFALCVSKWVGTEAHPYGIRRGRRPCRPISLVLGWLGISNIALK